MKKQSRIEKCFLKNKAYIGYLTAGDGGISRTLEAAFALIKGGVNMLEIGIPFSDPVADGPVIQRAAHRALAFGTTLKDVLYLIEEIRKKSEIPLVLFSYLNPILSAVSSHFLKEAKIAGVDGLLLVDCPFEESAFIREKCDEHDISLIYVITPSTTIERMKKMNEYAKGFLYYACQKGTTGMRDSLPDNFHEKIHLIKQIMPLPVVVGFGIANQAAAKNVLAYADGVVVGSYFVNALATAESPADLSELARTLVP